MKNIVILTGAGVSQESGIPTFRGAGSIDRAGRTRYSSLETFDRDPSLVWQLYHFRRCIISKCKPNDAHYAITALQQKFINAGRNVDIITQNIDGFHTIANTQNVIEMHGSIWNVKANQWNDATVVDDKYVWRNTDMPICKALKGTENNIGETVVINVEDLPHDEKGNLLRPAVVWFGEPLDTNVRNKCTDLLEACDMLIIAGTSGVVYPAAGFSEIVMNNYGHSFVAEFNLESSPNSQAFDFAFEGKAAELLPKAFDVEIE